MRPLIRPFLFTAARLGLLFAVLAWIVGQWWTVEIEASALKVMICPEGVVIGKGFELLPAVDICESERGRCAWQFQPFNLLHDDRVTTIQYPGFVLLYEYLEISLHHWLFTSILIAFNLLLHFIYRKRREIRTCED